jgi:hypothetical protein
MVDSDVVNKVDSYIVTKVDSDVVNKVDSYIVTEVDSDVVDKVDSYIVTEVDSDVVLETYAKRSFIVSPASPKCLTTAVDCCLVFQRSPAKRTALQVK